MQTTARTSGEMKVSGIVGRLARATELLVRPICNISGVPGMSVGVMHHGEVIYRDNLGWRDAAGTLAPTSETVYSIGSITKGFTTAAIASLFADREDLGWDTPVDRFLPGFRPKDERLQGLITVGDFMSHRSGLLGDMSFAFQGSNEFLVPPEDLVTILNGQEQAAPFRQEWLYNNWGYGIAPTIVKELSGKTYGEFLEEAVLRPLNLSHTTSQPTFGPEANFADANAALHNGAPFSLGRNFFLKDSVFEPSGGVYSNVDDMLSWSRAVLEADKNPSAEVGPLRDISTLISNQIPLDRPSRDFRFYGMGWVRTQLPGVVGLQGENPEILRQDELPILGTPAQPMVTYYHQGLSMGYCSALFLFPQTESAVVVLTNTVPLNDAADWIAQSYISALFGFDNPADYVGLAKKSRSRLLGFFDEMMDKVASIRSELGGQKPKPLDCYVGDYENTDGIFHIDVRRHEEDKNALEMRFQGRDTQAYKLRHLHGDVFEWAMGWDDQVRRQRVPVWATEYFLVRFNVTAGGEAGSLSWAAFDGIRPEGISMRRRPNTSTAGKDQVQVGRIQKVLSWTGFRG